MSKSWITVLVVSSALGARARGAEPTYFVDSTADAHDANPGDGVCETSTSGVCTLRAAVEQAVSDGGGTVRLPAGAYTLALGELVVDKSIEILGAGAQTTAIAGTAGPRMFTVSGSSPELPTSLALRDLTLRDAYTGSHGGALRGTIYTDIQLERCVISNCWADSGGAVSTFGSLSAVDTAFRDCHALGEGLGGAVQLLGNAVAGSAQFLRCTFSGNVAAAEGGALHVAPGYSGVTATNSTFSLNQSGSYGGAVRVAGSGITLDHVTITGNSSDAYLGGGGISSGVVADAVQISNSIVADNYSASGQLLVPGECSGALTSALCNIFGTGGTSGCTIIGAYIAAVPAFGPLKMNGGFTPTHALLAGSAGVDFGTCDSDVPPPADQRGVQRVRASADLGAYERSPCGDVDGDGSVTVADVFFLLNALFAGGPVPRGLANVNQDSSTDVLDVFHLITNLFAAGPAPVCTGT